MDKLQLEDQVSQLSDQIDSFFSRKTEDQGRAALKEYRDGILEQLSEMKDLLREHPFYGAVAFLGRFRFTDCPEVNALINESSVNVLEAIRAQKAVKIEESARSSWNYIRDSEPETACNILAICFHATKMVSITKHLNHTA